MMTPGTVHLVVPCYRESSRIGQFLPGLCREMDALGNVRILVVEDGSGENEAIRMALIIEELRTQHPCLAPLRTLPVNAGKGGAIYSGWEDHQDAAWLGFVDADGACSAAEVARLIGLARGEGENHRALFASRVKILGRRVERLLKRHLLGRVYATLVSEVLRIPVYDSQCGLKLVPRQAYERIADCLSVHGFAFDVELLVALLDSGCPVLEVPIDWKEIPGGKIRLLRDSWLMARDVLSIQRRRAGWNRGV